MRVHDTFNTNLVYLLETKFVHKDFYLFKTNAGCANVETEVHVLVLNLMQQSSGRFCWSCLPVWSHVTPVAHVIKQFRPWLVLNLGPQCDPKWRNFATLPNFKKLLAILWVII